MLLAQDALLDLQRLDVQRLRLVVAALIAVQAREVIHGSERVRMLLPQDALQDLQDPRAMRVTVVNAAMLFMIHFPFRYNTICYNR